MSVRRTFSLLAALVILPAAAQAQLTTGPMFSSPVTQPRVDIFGGDAYGTGVGLSLGVRPVTSLPGLRFRAGIADGRGTGPINGGYSDLDRQNEAVAYTVGIDYSAPIAAAETGLVRASLVTGISVGVNGGTAVSAPLGFSIGYNGSRIRPYITPRIILEHRTGNQVNHAAPFNSGSASNGISGAVDWGVDFVLPRGAVLRAAVTTGTYRGFGLGISF